MRLAAKLILLYLAGLLLIVVVFSFLTFRNEKRLAQLEHERHANELAATLIPQIEESARLADGRAAQRVLKRSTSGLRRTRFRLWSLSENSDNARLQRYLIARGELLTITTLDDAGDEWFKTLVPTAAGPLEIAAPAQPQRLRWQSSLAQAGISLAAVTLCSAIVIYVGGFWMVGRPLTHLIAKVQRVGKGDFTDPIRIASNDELGRLGAAINQMCSQLRQQRETIVEETQQRIDAVTALRHADRLSTVGRLAAGVAHELGTPLAVVSGRAELIAGGQLPDRDTQHSAAVIKNESDRIASIIRDLLNFARRGEPNRAVGDLGDVIARTVELTRPIADKHGVELAFNPASEPAMAMIDSNQFQQVVTNLLINGIESGGTQVTVKVRPGEHEHHVEVIDDGDGIDDVAREHLFEPFFTTKEVGEGTGLGLSIVYGILQDHDASIELRPVTDRSGGGSRFVVRMPAIATADVGV